MSGVPLRSTQGSLTPTTDSQIEEVKAVVAAVPSALKDPAVYLKNLASDDTITQMKAYIDKIVEVVELLSFTFESMMRYKAFAASDASLLHLFGPLP